MNLQNICFFSNSVYLNFICCEQNSLITFNIFPVTTVLTELFLSRWINQANLPKISSVMSPGDGVLHVNKGYPAGFIVLQDC